MLIMKLKYRCSPQSDISIDKFFVVEKSFCHSHLYIASVRRKYVFLEMFIFMYLSVLFPDLVPV